MKKFHEIVLIGFLFALALPSVGRGEELPTTPVPAASVPATPPPSPAPSPSASPLAAPWGSQGMVLDFPSPKASPSAKAPARKKKSKTPAQASPQPTLPPLLQEVEEKYSKAGTIQAHFEQVTESANLKQKKRTTGTIQIKIPNKIRWETLSPDKDLLVSDGNRFWFYTPPFDEEEDGQVIERKGSDVRSKLANALLSASFSTAQRKHGLKIIQSSPTRFTLLPRKGSAGSVVESKIEIDPQEKTIKKVILFHKDRNIAEISLSRIELGKPMEDGIFVFTPPPRTQVIKE